MIVAVDGATGARLFRTETEGPASLTLVFASDRIVVAERRGCFSADQPDPEGGTVLVGSTLGPGETLDPARRGASP